MSFELFTQNGATIRLNKEEKGSGDPVIALHGIAASMYAWRFLVPPLAQKRRVILFDLKGHGQSDRPRDDKYALADQADLIFRFIVRKDLRNLALVGHSLGAGICLLTVLRLMDEDKGRLQKLVLCASPALSPKLPFFAKGAKLPFADNFLAPLLRLSPRLAVRIGLHYACFEPRRFDSKDIDAYAEGLSPPGTAYALIQTLRQVVPDNLNALVQRFKMITVPTLLLWGENDPVSPFENADRLATEIPGSRLVSYPDCGHLVQEEKNQQATLEIVKFLT
jgi:pimeloyl-ACP methyl ester carboxylesterase